MAITPLLNRSKAKSYQECARLCSDHEDSCHHIVWRTPGHSQAATAPCVPAPRVTSTAATETLIIILHAKGVNVHCAKVR